MSDDSPLDRFKSVLTGASRAIAHEPEVEVAWTADAPIAAGKNFRVPMPGRNLPRDQALEARGFADSFALKLRLHDEALHSRKAPPEPAARACYDAVETVRYEALGSKAYAGMRANLDAALMVRIGADPITRAARPEEVPVQAALALLLREHLTGQPRQRGPGSICCAAGSRTRLRPISTPWRCRSTTRNRSSRSASTCCSTSS
jgi:cobaltochelatase CobT